MAKSISVTAGMSEIILAGTAAVETAETRDAALESNTRRMAMTRTAPVCRAVFCGRQA